MEYQTDSVDALEKYAIVQFKKGCVFYSSKNREGKISRNLGDIVSSFGEDIPFCFREWIIDSQDTDPAYNSDPEYGRFYLLRWNKSGSYERRTQKYYGVEKPKIPVVYMADYPAGAFVTGTGVKMSLWNSKPVSIRRAMFPQKRDETTQTLQSPSTALTGRMFMSMILIMEDSRPIWRMFRGGNSHSCP